MYMYFNGFLLKLNDIYMIFLVLIPTLFLWFIEHLFVVDNIQRSELKINILRIKGKKN